MNTGLTIASAMAAAAVLALNPTVADAGGPKFKYGPGHHANKVPTYLMDTVDESSQDPGAPGTIWVGSGIPATNFVRRVYEHGGVELAIKAHYRQGSDILPSFVDEDGTIHVKVPAGPQVADPEHDVPGPNPDRARWNFTFSYNVGLKPGNPDLDRYRGWLLIDIDPSRRTKFLPLRLDELTDSPTGQQSGYGWVKGDTVVIGDDEGTSQVTQNSQNLAFYDDLIDADPWTPGKQSYKDAGFGPGQFDVVMVLERKGGYHGKRGHHGHHGRKISVLRAVFDVVEP